VVVSGESMMFQRSIMFEGSTRLSSRISFLQKSAGYVTKFAQHKALTFIA
jgi:hypothetical protein